VLVLVLLWTWLLLRTCWFFLFGFWNGPEAEIAFGGQDFTELGGAPTSGFMPLANKEGQFRA
jgi:hypothetical protein